MTESLHLTDYDGDLVVASTDRGCHGLAPWALAGSVAWMSNATVGSRSIGAPAKHAAHGRGWDERGGMQLEDLQSKKGATRLQAGPTSPATILTIVKEFKRYSDQVAAGRITDKQAHCILTCLICALLGPLNAAAAGIIKEAIDELFPGGSGWDDEDLVADANGIECCSSMGFVARALALVSSDPNVARSHCEECCRQ